ncbi:hypothetical protein T11_6835 [Trichinella zimbabwensis]|uniref:Uncharacterized protein n=1 Tax=Trichinella zimbabwensis TaxID=268475 RepID=A0A0V1HMR4_9BILA|nr:hypothetical protein T11_6835 [Trichinella zimbabwensis]
MQFALVRIFQTNNLQQWKLLQLQLKIDVDILTQYVDTYYEQVEVEVEKEELVSATATATATAAPPPPAEADEETAPKLTINQPTKQASKRFLLSILKSSS